MIVLDASILVKWFLQWELDLLLLINALSVKQSHLFRSAS